MDIALASIILVTLAVVLAARLRFLSQPTQPQLWPTRSLSDAPIFAKMVYANAGGDIVDVAISAAHLGTWRGSGCAPPVYFYAFCHLQEEERSFRFEGILEITFADQDLPIGKYDGAALHLLMRMGERPCCLIPELLPGQRPCAHNLPTPIHVLVRRQDAEGNVETFEVQIAQLELADGYVFAFSGETAQRDGETASERIDRRRFKLRGWDTLGTPVLAMADHTGQPIHAPHRWLAESARNQTSLGPVAWLA